MLLHRPRPGHGHGSQVCTAPFRPERQLTPSQRRQLPDSEGGTIFWSLPALSSRTRQLPRDHPGPSAMGGPPPSIKYRCFLPALGLAIPTPVSGSFPGTQPLACVSQRNPRRQPGQARVTKGPRKPVPPRRCRGSGLLRCPRLGHCTHSTPHPSSVAFAAIPPLRMCRCH